MADIEIVYDTHLRARGPWLLPESALLALDDVIATEWPNLQRRRGALIEARISDAVQKTHLDNQRELSEEFLSSIKRTTDLLVGPETRRLKVFCEGGRFISAASFSDALRSPEALNEKPKGFSLRIHCGDTQGEMELEEHTGRMSVTVRPVEAREARELFVALRRWTMEYRAPLWQRLWRELVGFHWVIWLLFIWLGLLFLPEVPNSARQGAISEGKRLLEGGLTKQELESAEKVLLTMAVTEETGAKRVTAWYKALFFGGLGISLCLSFAPKTAIALGKGVTSVVAWQRWARLVGITIPAYLFGTFLWPSIEAVIRSLF